MGYARLKAILGVRLFLLIANIIVIVFVVEYGLSAYPYRSKKLILILIDRVGMLELGMLESRYANAQMLE